MILRASLITTVYVVAPSCNVIRKSSMFNHEARAGMSRPKGREDFSATASRACDESLGGPFATHPAGGAG
jgi:hypothetical protein